MAGYAAGTLWSLDGALEQSGLVRHRPRPLVSGAFNTGSLSERCCHWGGVRQSLALVAPRGGASPSVTACSHLETRGDAAFPVPGAGSEPGAIGPPAVRLPSWGHPGWGRGLAGGDAPSLADPEPPTGAWGDCPDLCSSAPQWAIGLAGEIGHSRSGAELRAAPYGGSCPAYGQGGPGPLLLPALQLDKPDA